MTILQLSALLSVGSGALAILGIWMIKTERPRTTAQLIVLMLAVVIPALCAAYLLFARHITLAARAV